jgi:hypothetical protein
MMESRLGVGWKSVLLRRLCDEGRIRAVNARLTHSPSTPPIRTSEFFIADLRMFSRFVGYDPAWWLPWLWWDEFLWRLQRKDPGCDVGEHVHVFLGMEIGLRWFCMTWLRLGEMDRWSMVNRTEVESGTAV